MYNKRMYPQECTNDGNQKMQVNIYKGIIKVHSYIQYENNYDKGLYLDTLEKGVYTVEVVPYWR